MRLIYIFSTLAVLFISCGLIIKKTDNPEKLLIGKWEEVAYEYERINQDKINSNEIYRNLNIHKAEVWQFEDAHKLTLFDKKNEKKILSWNVKGRGHILEIQHQNKRFEGYQIQEITKDKLVIHFNVDLQIRGIVKLTFKKIKEKNA